MGGRLLALRVVKKRKKRSAQLATPGRKHSLTAINVGVC
jgi:hypothetical protein